MYPQCFFGFLPRFNDLPPNLPKPTEGKKLWNRGSPLWIKGRWNECEIITVSKGVVRLAILGKCLACKEDVVELFNKAIKKGNYSELTKLPGNYNVIVQDPINTYIFTDVAGVNLVFYSVCRDFVVYSSFSIIIRQLIKANLNSKWLAANLIYCTTPEWMKTLSPFEGIKTIPAGHYLQLSSGKTICKNYWNPPQGNSDTTEISVQLCEQLLKSIEHKTTFYNTITSDLSGGLDSTSLALLTAKNLANKNRQITTMTHASGAINNSEDVDRAFRAAALYPNINMEILERQNFPVHCSNLEKTPLTDEPNKGIAFIDEFNSSMNIVKSKDSDLHLSGHGGDSIFSTPISYLADMLQKGQLVKFIWHSYGWARLWKLTPIALMTSAIKLSATQYHRWAYQSTRQPISRYESKQIEFNYGMTWSNFPLFVDWYKKRTFDLATTELKQCTTTTIPFSNHPGQHYSIVSIQEEGRRCRIVQQMADIYGVNLDFPYLDSSIINSCLLTKIDQRSNPYVYKPLLRETLRHVLPKSVLNRSTAGDYSFDVLDGINKNLFKIKKLFQNSYLGDMGLINTQQLITNTDKLCIGISTTLRQFIYTLACEVWLRRIEEDKHNFWM